MKPKFFITTLLVVIMVSTTNAACGLPFLAKPTPTPTITPTPTFTPTATATPSPTSTDTPTPRPTATATPNAKATLQAKLDQQAREILTGFNLSTDSGEFGWYQTKAVTIDLKGPSGDFSKISDLVKISDFVFFTEMTWNTDSWPTCGLMVRSDNRWFKGDSYLLQFLRFSGLPAWDIEYYKNGEFFVNITQEVRFSSYLELESGDTNRIVLAATGNEFKVWINDNYEGRYYDDGSKRTIGGLAFYAGQNAGKTTCSFDNSWIWIYK